MKDDPKALLTVCSTRLALLSEKEQRECGVARPVARVQLKSRHWRIRTIKGELVDEVVGDGVVGAHPVLEAGAHLQMILSLQHDRRSGRPPCAGSQCAHPVVQPVWTFRVQSHACPPCGLWSPATRRMLGLRP